MRVIRTEIVSYPAEEDATKALLCHDGAPCLEVGLVELCVDLTTALDEIKRSDGGVSRAAGCGCYVNENPQRHARR